MKCHADRQPAVVVITRPDGGQDGDSSLGVFGAGLVVAIGWFCRWLQQWLKQPVRRIGGLNVRWGPLWQPVVAGSVGMFAGDDGLMAGPAKFEDGAAVDLPGAATAKMWPVVEGNAEGVLAAVQATG